MPRIEAPPTASAFAQTARLLRLPLKGGVDSFSTRLGLTLNKKEGLPPKGGTTKRPPCQGGVGGGPQGPFANRPCTIIAKRNVGTTPPRGCPALRGCPLSGFRTGTGASDRHRGLSLRKPQTPIHPPRSVPRRTVRIRAKTARAFARIWRHGENAGAWQDPRPIPWAALFRKRREFPKISINSRKIR